MNYKSRKDIPTKYKWDIEAMYKDKASCEADIKKCLALADKLTKYQGHLKDDAKTLAKALKEREKMTMLAEDIIIYAHMKKDEDGKNANSIELSGKAMAMGAQISQKKTKTLRYTNISLMKSLEKSLIS